LVINGDGTVTDNDTGLMWQQATALGNYTWEGALDYCEDLTLAGRSDWRLPTAKELLSLVDYSRYNPAINITFFPDTVISPYRSSTHFFQSDAFSVAFFSGYNNWSSKYNSNYVRAVRGGQSVPLGNLVISALPSSTGNAPFTVNFIANAVNITVDRYEWDFNNDGVADAVTLDNRLTHTFDVIGDYPVQVTAVATDATRYEDSVVIHVLPPEPVSQNIRFAPFYPESDGTASQVMKGGKAVRWYRILDENDLPVTGKKLYGKYDLVVDDYAFSTDIDDQGFVAVETPPMTDSGDYTLIVTDAAGIPVTTPVADVPAFHVTVMDRTFAEAYTLLIGLNGRIGIAGPGAEIGCMEFKTAKASLTGGKNVSNRILLETTGETTDLLVENIIDTEMGVDAFAGISGGLFKTWINENGRPKLEAGTGFTGSLTNAMTTRYEFEDFANNSRLDHDVQLLASAALFFENLILSKQFLKNNILSYMVLQAIIYQVNVVAMESYYESIGNTCGFKTSAYLGAELSLKNPLGLSATRGFEPVIKAHAFEGNYIYEHLDEQMSGNRNRITQTVSASLDVGNLVVGFSQKFGGDKRRNDTPRLQMDLIDASLYYLDGEESISVEKRPDGEILEYAQLLNRTGGNTYFLYSVTNEKYLRLIADNPEAVDYISRNADVVRQMRSGDNIELKPLSYTLAQQAFQNIDQGRVGWETTAREIKLISIPVNIGGSLGLDLGLGFKVDTESVLEYANCKGLILPGKGMIHTQMYEKDSQIADNIKGWQMVINEYREKIDAVVKDVLETFTKIKDQAQEAIVETRNTIQEGGAKLKASADAFANTVTIKLSALLSGDTSYRILAKAAGSAQTITVSTIGDVYVVNVTDENGVLINDFAVPLELTIGYTDAALQAAGFLPADAAKLKIYRWDETTGYYHYIGGAVDMVNYSVTAMISHSGQYVLAIDELAPQVLNFAVSNNTPQPHVNFSVNDNLSGVDATSISILLDGVEVINNANYADYFDVYTGYFDWQPQALLSAGQHMVSITVGDSAGNSETHEFAFTVNDVPPAIVHTPVISAPSGASLGISADVSDDETVKTVLLQYRPKTGETPYTIIEMTNTEGTPTFTASIPKEFLTSFGTRYTIKAVDVSGNETEMDPVDIAVADNTGPEILGSLSSVMTEDGFRLSWEAAVDADVSGYRIYLGDSPETMTLFNDNGNSTWTVIAETHRDKYAAVAAFDETGNEGLKIGPVQLNQCFPGDVNCDGVQDLLDAILALQNTTGIAVEADIFKTADVNKDGKIGNEEAIYMMEKVAGVRE